MQASDLDFAQVQYFSAGEFPNIRTEVGTYSVLTFLEASIIRALDRYRGRLGKPVVPSPVAGAWIREGGSPGSQHYVGPIKLYENGEPQSQRLGVAADFFPLCDIREAFLVALSMPEFGGIGVYLDTHRNGRPAPMMHLDLRTGTRQIWLRDGDGMLYPGRGDAQMKRFFQKLAAG
jgi:hypothetical protein